MKWRIIFLSGKVGNVEVGKESVARLKQVYPNSNIKGLTAPVYDAKANPQTEPDKKRDLLIKSEINRFQPHILFIGMTPPKQERWLEKNLRSLKVGLAIAVGGTFDYMAGVHPEPPKWIGKLELEWLWRLFSQKGRVKRVLTAFPLFPLRIFWQKLTK